MLKTFQFQIQKSISDSEFLFTFNVYQMADKDESDLVMVSNESETRAPDKLRFYAMKTSKNAYIIRSECTHYANILLCKQTFQIRSVLVQSCT